MTEPIDSNRVEGDHPILGSLGPELIAFLEIVCRPWREQRKWPVLDFVERQSRLQLGWSVTEAISRLPIVHGAGQLPRYQLAFFEHGPTTDASQKIGLTIGGLYHAGETQAATTLVRVIGFLADQDAALAPDPYQVVSLDLPLIDLLTTHLRRELNGWRPDVLADALYREPVLFGSVGRGSDARIRPDTTQLVPYRGVQDPVDYLRRVAASLGARDLARPPSHVSPLGLVDALGYLDAVWRSLLGAPLLGRTQPASSARLALPASSTDEFDARLSALADVLGHLVVTLPPKDERLAKGERSLARLRRRLSLLLEGPAFARADAAIGTLRQIVRVRTSGQHSGLSETPAAFRVLGLAYPPADYGAAWANIRNLATDAVNAIREELQVIETESKP